jgi:hypothetical protein
VKHLNIDGGSYFNIKTPVGAAGIRGTTFRIVFRPTSDGKAFNFTLSTAEGVVQFTGTTQARGTGVDVPKDKEVVVTAQVDPATNQITSMQISDVQNISPAAIQQITLSVSDSFIQAQPVIFTPTEQQTAPDAVPTAPKNNLSPPDDNTSTTPRVTSGDGSGGG